MFSRWPLPGVQPGRQHPSRAESHSRRRMGCHDGSVPRPKAKDPARFDWGALEAGPFETDVEVVTPGASGPAETVEVLARVAQSSGKWVLIAGSAGVVGNRVDAVVVKITSRLKGRKWSKMRRRGRLAKSFRALLENLAIDAVRDAVPTSLDGGSYLEDVRDLQVQHWDQLPDGSMRARISGGELRASVLIKREYGEIRAHVRLRRQLMGHDRPLVHTERKHGRRRLRGS